MINDIIQLLGIANPQLSKAWTNRGSTTATTLPTLGADKFTYTCDAGDEWLAPVGGILTENQHHKLLQLPDGSTPATCIVLQLAPQVYLGLKRLYAAIIEAKTNTDDASRPVPKYFLYNGNTKLLSGDPAAGLQPGFYTAGTALRLTGKLTIHDEEGIVIDPLAVANAFDTFTQAHASLEIKALGTTSATLQSSRQTFHIAKSLVVGAGTTERRIYFTDIFNAPSNPGGLANITLIAGSVYQLNRAGTPISGTDNLFQISLSTTGTFANALNYPTAAITLVHDFVRVKTVGWKSHLLGDTRDNDTTAAKGVLPELRDNELISFCLNGNECLGQIGKITSELGAEQKEQTIVSPDIREDVNLPPPPSGTGNHLWPAFAQEVETSSAAIDANLKNTLATFAHFITDAATNNTDVYFQITTVPPALPLTNGLAIRVFHRVFHPDGTETRGDSVIALTRAINNARQFIYIEGSFFGPTQYPATAGGEIPPGDLVDVINKRLDARPGLKVILCLAQDIPFNRGYDNMAKFHLANRNRSVLRLLGAKNETTQRYARQHQVVAFHPLGFPGRPIKINTQCVIIDDVWAMMGSSNFSQRGFFFDGSTDIVFCDKQVRNGKSLSIQNLRRSLMEQYLRMDNPSATIPDSKRVFLQSGSSAFEMFRSLIDGGGAMVREFVPVELTGIDAPELTALQNLADPNGDSFYQAQAMLNTWLAALSTVPE